MSLAPMQQLLVCAIALRSKQLKQQSQFMPVAAPAAVLINGLLAIAALGELRANLGAIQLAI